MSDQDLSKQFKALHDEWGQAIANKRYDWFERHFAEDFLGTSQVWPTLSVNKAKMIELDKNIEKMDVRWVEVTARRFGQVVLTTGVVEYFNEQFKPGAVIGEGMPTGQELSESVNGKQVLYIGAWRENAGVWQVFDHHQVAIL